MRYNHQQIESKWQKFWEENRTFSVSNDFNKKKKFYALIEFPYPSGEGLHVGHPRSNTAMDIISRKRRMEGYDVLYPIGFDSFGLPTENYAIKTGTHPAIVTQKNIEIFTRQLKSLGFSFDWERQFSTTDPDYYKWTQWIFLKMFEHGLAYKEKMPINWCPLCKIGLANEEVVAGKCERCGTVVEKKEKEQWILKITKYADRLIEDLQSVDYLEQIKTQQINWIGRSEGAEIEFRIRNQESGIKIFTTRPDTIFGATFMVLAPEHELIEQLRNKISNIDEVDKYIKEAKQKSEIERTDEGKEKTGVELKGVKAVNPATNEEISLWIADYVLVTYGTGAIMAVPAHDQRDWEFATKYNIPIVEVISGGDISKQAFTEIEVGTMINSGAWDGLAPFDAIKAAIDWLEKEKIGNKKVQYKLRDWIFSRQRYWGEPIPLVFCENCAANSNLKNHNSKLSEGELLNPGWFAVPEKNLPLTLPDVKSYEPTDTGESPLAAIDDWVKTTCPVCGGPARRETDTMPNWAGSNWYYMRYADPHNNETFASEKALKYWMPVDWYNGGMEHTTLHLLYSRFVYKFLWDIGAVPRECGPEPYKKRTSQGMILGQSGEKMSKSRGNVINPDDVVVSVGADAFRTYEMFMGPFDQAIPWDTNGLSGVRRFLERVWNIYNGEAEIVEDADNELISLCHRTIIKVGNDIETQGYNTAVSALMILSNEIFEQKKMNRFIAESFLLMLSPFAPHMTEELWEKIGNTGSIAHAQWPDADKKIAQLKEVSLVVQINGKVRDTIFVPFEISQAEVEKMLLERHAVQKWVSGKTPKKIIFVPGRLINIVV